MNKQEVIHQLEELMKSGDVDHISAQLDILENEFLAASEEHDRALSETFLANGGEEGGYQKTMDAEDIRFEELVSGFRNKEKEQVASTVDLEEIIEPGTEPVIESVEPEERDEVVEEIEAQIESAPAIPEGDTNVPENTAGDDIANIEKTTESNEPPAKGKRKRTAKTEDGVILTKPELVKELEELLKGNDIELMAGEIESLEAAFQKLSDDNEHAQLEAFKAEGGEEIDFHAVKDNEDSRFKELVNIFNERHEKFEKQQASSQEESIRTRRELIEELKKLIKDETDISRAFNSFKEVQEKWRKAAPLPIKQYKQLQSEYSHMIDMFFYTIDIYRALKFHDFSKNLETKKALIENMTKLAAEPSIRKAEVLVKSYQNEWIETGPVPNEQWKDLRDEFRKATNTVYDKIQAHYDSLKEVFNKNLEEKNALLEKVKHFAEVDADNHKKWQDKTEELLVLQKEWKTIGPAQKKDNERVWKEFRTACDVFFSKKKAFYDGRKEEFNAHRDKKNDLIRQAEALKESIEWKNTTEKLVQLQNQWKEVGAAGQKDEQKLWSRFRGACNFFFEAKKQYYATLDDRLAVNLQEREELVKKIEAFEPTGNNGDDLNALREFSNDWRNIGHAPRKEADRINEAYKKALDAKYDSLKIGKQEKADLRYKSKIEGLQTSDQSGKSLDNERRFIRDSIKKLEDTISQYENNLLFFGRSKGAEALKADVLKKIDQSKEELAGWKQKLKVLQQTAK